MFFSQFLAISEWALDSINFSHPDPWSPLSIHKRYAFFSPSILPLREFIRPKSFLLLSVLIVMSSFWKIQKLSLKIQNDRHFIMNAKLWNLKKRPTFNFIFYGRSHIYRRLSTLTDRPNDRCSNDGTRKKNAFELFSLVTPI